MAGRLQQCSVAAASGPPRTPCRTTVRGGGDDDGDGDGDDNYDGGGALDPHARAAAAVGSCAPPVSESAARGRPFFQSRSVCFPFARRPHARPVTASTPVVSVSRPSARLPETGPLPPSPTPRLSSSGRNVSVSTPDATAETVRRLHAVDLWR